jgi:hypothetical protein
MSNLQETQRHRITYSANYPLQLGLSTYLLHITKTSIIMPASMNSTDKPQTTKTSASSETAHTVENPSTQSVASTTHSQKTEQEREAERRYEEAIEEEYAKREGGA